VPQAPTSGPAIVSLVASILWFAGIGSIVAIITGHIGRRKARTQQFRGGGIALAGLILGYVGLFSGIVITTGICLTEFNSHVAGAFVRDDLRGAASAERDYYSEHFTYTDLEDEISSAGFLDWPGNTIEVGVSGGDGYCVVGHRHDSAWYLYDSTLEAVAPGHYASEQDAKDACSVTGITGYAPIS
jgi:hypothetical protein